MTGASVNFKAVKSAGHAVLHASREVAPTYLLPPDKSMGTVVVLDDAGKVSQVLDAKMALASPRAKVDQRYSPVWEGILNLRRPEPGEDAEEYRAECSAVVTDWYKQYEAATGHKVLRVDIHLDEGRMVDGEALLNAHAHVIADRTNELGRVIKLSPKQLRELQTMTAEVTSLERGKSSFETGRKHISHQAYKHLAEQGRLETQQVKVKLDREIKLTTHNIKEARTAKAQVLDLKGQLSAKDAEIARYKAEREAMKASGTATQQAYQAIKIAHEAALATIKKATQRIEKMDEYTQKLESDLAKKDAQIASELVAKAEVIEALVKSGEKSDALLKTAIGHRAAAEKLTGYLAVSERKLEKLTDELVDVKAKFAEMATEYQAAKAAGTPAHLIVPGEAPSTPSRGAKPGLSGEKAVTPSGLHDPRAIEQPKTPAEQPKTQNPDIPTPKPEKSLGEALKATLKEFFHGWVEFIKHKGFTHEELDVSKGQYRGTILDKDDVFAVQKTGRHTCVIHLLDDLDMNPDMDNPDILIRYQDGHGRVSGQEKYPSPGVGR